MVSDSRQERPSLAEVFNPPDQHRQGIFGLTCAYSADAAFLEMALQSFTGMTSRARSRTGHVALVLVTDPHQPHLGRDAPPALYHAFAERKGQWPRQMALMHAKVALLAFGPARTGEPDLLRLVVSTGNWTVQSANRSIDLVWFCDLPVMPQFKREVRQEAADFRAAAAFFRSLLSDSSGLRFYRLDTPIRDRVDTLLTRCESLAQTILGDRGTPRPRFFSTLSKAPKKYTFGQDSRSMGSQVIHRFAKDGIQRNFIVAGSGFFEKARQGESGCPRVLTKLCRKLNGTGVLSKSLDEENRMLVANPGTAGAVAQWLHHTEEGERGWCPCKFKHPDREAGVTLHAKYLFLARARNEYNSYSSGLLYLGSGNLSWQGFAMAPLTRSEKGRPGNIEAGVAMPVQIPDWATLCDSLGIDGDNDFECDDFKADADGEDEGEDAPLQVPPPVLGLTWCAVPPRLQIRWSGEEQLSRCTLRWGSIYIPVEPGHPSVSLPAEAPPPVRVQVERGESSWTVPVFAANADFCSPPPVPRSFDEVLGLLFDFPACTAVEDEEPDDDPTDGEDGQDRGGDGDGGENDLATVPYEDLAKKRRGYPIRRAMELVEVIAQRNQLLAPGLLPDWVAHLRRLLLEELNEEIVTGLRGLELNFLAPLLTEPGFAPAEADDSYRAFIREVMERWGLEQLPPLLPGEKR